MTVKKYVKKLVTYAPKVLNIGGVAKVEWEIATDEDLSPEERANRATTITQEYIQEAKPNCGCTADVIIKDGKIYATYTDDTKPTAEFVAGYYIAKKAITLYMKDGKPMNIQSKKPDGRVVTLPNPQKEAVVISFKYTVKQPGQGWLSKLKKMFS